MTVRVRFAPSPTGYLHVGGARTALYNYLYAKKNGGTFVLRIEDTDVERSTEEAMRMQIGDLKWLGLPWAEGPNPETLKDMGPYGPYRQSQRKAIYMEQANKLLDAGHAYYDFRTDEELEKLKAGDGEGVVHHIPRPDKIVSADEGRKRVAAGEKAAIRFKIKESKEYVFTDLVRGEVRLPSDMVSDFVLIRSNGMPVYNFCCVVDDALMKITHVFRAEEHLSNTVRQMMIYEALGMPVPKFGHMSFILGPDRQKLSKRHGATSCNDFNLRGYLPEAILNYIALLGWSSPKENQEIMSMEEMAQLFDYDRLHSAPAVFDEEKLNWMNATHLRALPTEELWKRVKAFLVREGIEVPDDKDWVEKALSLFKPRMTTLADAVTLFRPLSDSAYKVGDESKEVLGWAETPKVWDAWEAGLKAHASDYLSEPDFNALQDKVKDAAGVKGKHLFMPIRVAVIGKPSGAELKELVPLLKKTSLLKRVQQARSARL
jgi:nondiscriminating glutamyl-tRNA synthetase